MSLHDNVVPTYIQFITSLKRIVMIAESARLEGNSKMTNILDARLAPDMMPLSFQINSIAVHSLSALKALISGEFDPQYSATFKDLSDVASYLTELRAEIAALDKESIDAAANGIVIIQTHGLDLSFTGSDFLTSFEQPNFFFHVVTAYAIFRTNGLAIGKFDYLGRLRSMPKPS